MSERGSFVTEYIYCQKCFSAAKDVLLGDSKFLCSQTIISWEVHPQPTEMPIIAGKVGGCGAGDEVRLFENELIPVLEQKICHDLRIVVIPDSGNVALLTAKPLCTQ